MQIQEMRASQAALVIGVIQPAVLIVVTFGLHDRPDPEVATRLAAGVTLTVLWASTIWTAGGILRREVFQGTLAANVTGARSPYLVVLGKTAGATVASAGSILATTAVTVTALGMPVRLGRPAWLVVCLLVTLASTSALGLLLSCLFLLTRHAHQLSSALMYPVFILGGMLVPTDILPQPARWVSALITLRWANEFLVAAASGRVEVAPGLVLLALTGCYAVAAVVVFGHVVNRARRDGVLDLA